MIRGSSRRYLLQWLLLGIALLTLGAVLGYWIYSDHREMEAVEGDRLQVQARVVEENLERQLGGIKDALDGIRHEMVRWDGKTMRVEASRRLDVLHDAMPGVRTLIVLDAGGTALASNRSALIGRNFSERDYFKIPRARPDATVLYVSPPFKTVFNVVTIDLTRVLIGPSGEFAGVVSAALDPAYFNVLMRSVLYAPDMRAVLAHWDGSAFVSVPPREGLTGMYLARPGTFFSRHRDSGQAATLFVNTSLYSGDERMMASRTINSTESHMDKPLVVHVSRNLSAIFAAWHRDAYQKGWMFAALVVATTLGLLAYQKRQRIFDQLAADQELERKQADEALRGAAKRHLAILQTAMDGFWMADTQGCLLEVNQTYCQMSGYTEQELLRMRIPDLEAEDAADNSANHMQEIIVSREDRFESRHRRKDGSIFDVEISVQYRPDGGGRYVAFLRDITERRQAEAAYARLEARLHESQKMEALGTLAGGIAHDFNNMLAIITGNVELVRQDLGPAHPALQSLEEVGKASRRAKDLVQQILAFGRRQKIERKPTSLSLVVLESARLIRAGLPAKVRLDVDCKADTPPVLADAAQVSQILLNLCGNAAQAVQGQERPGVIEIRLEGCAQNEASGALRPGRYACLTVRDNGSGMDEQTRSRVFEPFFTTKRVGEGTGLGLSVVHGIVEAHGASIEVESSPGQGSTFRVYFPAIDGPVPADAAPATNAATVDGKGKHILYLDDEAGLVLLMQRLLQRQGFRVSGYTEAERALAAVRADPGQFDVAVTDYNMPNLSGLEVAQALKAIRADLPVVLASGYITEELRVKAHAAGVRDLIYKPNTVDELCAAVSRFAKTQAAEETSKPS